MTGPERVPFGAIDFSAELFSNDLMDGSALLQPRHLLLNGGSGSGKTTVLRSLMPGVQSALTDTAQRKLSFLAVYVPLNHTNFQLAELQRLENRHASSMLNEHFLVMHCLMHLAAALKGDLRELAGEQFESLLGFYRDAFVPILALEDQSDDCADAQALAEQMYRQLRAIWDETILYMWIGTFSTELRPYTTAMYDYGYHLAPVLEALADALLEDARDGVYLLLDDAQALTETQTGVLNSWIISGGSARISLKISCDGSYKTIHTTNGSLVQTPFDYLALDVTELWEDTPEEHFAQILDKRLSAAGIHTRAERFFPEDHRYRYSGIGSLARFCGGSVRLLLELAGKMFAKSKGEIIAPEIQEAVIRAYARRFFPEARTGELGRLNHLLDTIVRRIGRTFTFVLDGDISESQRRSLELGVRLGYLRSRTIGRQTTWYLERRLAPIWELDLSGTGETVHLDAARLRHEMEAEVVH